MNSQQQLLPENKNTELKKNSQVGAVLVTSIVILLVMTLIGLTGMRITSLEEKMASNMRSRNLAFQAAESALREAEDAISANRPDCFGGVNGCYPSGSLHAVFDNPENYTLWDNANTVAFVGGGGILANIHVKPEYIIQEIQVDDGSSLDGSSTASFIIFYRVTARGIGGTTLTAINPANVPPIAIAIVRSVFKR